MLAAGTLVLAATIASITTESSRVTPGWLSFGQQDVLPDVTTLAEVDRAALDAGLVACDCGGELGGIPIVGVQDVFSAENKSNQERGRVSGPADVYAAGTAADGGGGRDVTDVGEPTTAGCSRNGGAGDGGDSGGGGDGRTCIDPDAYQTTLCYLRYVIWCGVYYFMPLFSHHFAFYYVLSLFTLSLSL